MSTQFGFTLSILLSFHLLKTNFVSFCLLSKYCSLGIEHPLTKERPPATFGPISCIGAKVYLNEHPLCSKLHVEFENRTLKRYAYLR